MSTHELNLQGISCPMNFVKTKLYLDKLSPGELLKVLLDAGEPLESVTTSLKAEGHLIMEQTEASPGQYWLVIRKV